MNQLLAARNDLASARKDLGWSQARLAARLGLSRSELAKMETGEKPLNNQALTFIGSGGDGKSVPASTSPKSQVKSEKLGTNKPTNLNDLQKALLAKMPGRGSRIESWEKWWFSVTNPVCVPCVRTCKQSAMVKVIVCPERQTREDEDE